MARVQPSRSALQWLGLCLALVGIPVGIFLLIDIVMPQAQDAIRSGETPAFDLVTNLKVMSPIVLGIVGINLFLHKSDAPKHNDLLKRFITRFFGAFASGTVILGAVFSFLWLTGNAHDQYPYPYAWLFAAALGGVVGIGYAALDWFYGYVPKSQGGRREEGNLASSDDR